VLWELAKLAHLGRIDLDIDLEEFGKFLAPVQVWPLTLKFARACGSWTSEAIRPTS